MKSKKFLIALPALFAAISMTACGGGDEGGSSGGGTISDIPTYEMPDAPAGSGEITVWVGEESVEFYQTAANEWVSQMHADNDQFNWTVTVSDFDSGGAAAKLELDNTTCADIVTVAHDNIGKLAQKKLIKPFNSKGLYEQVEADNTKSFYEVAHSVVDNERAIYGVPYIAQSLFLMYDKRYVSEEQAKTFEGLSEAAAARGDSTKAIELTGDDGFNFSFTLLAVKESDKSTTMEIYKDGDRSECWAQGEDSVANLQWARRYHADPHGMKLKPSTNGWATDVKMGGCLGIISGAWKYKEFSSAIGATNVGVAPIPTYTLTEDDVAGTEIEAGTVMRGGTFADFKALLINSASAGNKYVAEQSLVKFLSKKDIQNRSLMAADNLPSYDGAAAYIEQHKDELGVQKYQLAKAQTTMFSYGRPQPFITGILNYCYYQSGAPGLYAMCVENAEGDMGTTRAAREILYRMQYIWENAKDPQSAPATLPAQI